MNSTKGFDIMGKINGSQLWTYLAIGAALGLVMGIAVLLRKYKNRKPIRILPTLEELLRKQIVCKTLTASRVTKWADECIRKHPDRNLVFLFGRLTERTLPMFTTSRVIAPNIDPENYMFIEAVDNGTKFPMDVVIVNCTELDETLSELLENDDYRLITNEEDND